MAFELVTTQDEIQIDGFHSVYYFEFGKDFYHPPESHDFWELVYIDSGRVNAIVDGIGCTLEQGEMICHSPMELHTHTSNKKDPNNMVVISFTCPSPVMGALNKKVFRLEKGARKVLSLFLAEAKNALGQLPSRFEDTSPLDFTHAAFGACQMMKCYLTELLFLLLRSQEESTWAVLPSGAGRSLAENTLADSMQTYLQNHLCHTVTLAEICTVYRISKAYACRIFRAATGKSPIEYFIDLKIREAKRLLREDRLNVTQIAEHLGYSSIHHFTRMFKRITGFSPLAYRKSVVE